MTPEPFGRFGWTWKILHVGFSTIPLSGHHTIIVAYPLIPWIAVIAAAYCFGVVFTFDAERRRRWLAVLGTGLTAGFVLLRRLNVYGDPSPWSVQPTTTLTVLSFLRTTKYPPSLQFLLMTLGPALLFLAAIDRMVVSKRNFFLMFGRVPLFYYAVHWYAIHLVALVMAWARYGHAQFIFGFPGSALGPLTGYPADYGYQLRVAYAVWIGIVLALYPACRWFAEVKANNRSAWLSYV